MPLITYMTLFNSKYLIIKITLEIFLLVFCLRYYAGKDFFSLN